MTKTPQRQRGRPKGSGLNDTPAMMRIADLMVEGRAQNVAAAARLLAGNDPSLIRRLQRKFRHNRSTLMAAAQVRAEQAALQEGARQNQILRATQPLAWRHAYDPSMQLTDALTREREETLKRIFGRR